MGLIDKPLRYGTQFVRPSKTELRKHRAENGKKLFTGKTVRALIDAAAAPLKQAVVDSDYNVSRTRVSAIPFRDGAAESPAILPAFANAGASANQMPQIVDRVVERPDEDMCHGCVSRASVPTPLEFVTADPVATHDSRTSTIRRRRATPAARPASLRRLQQPQGFRRRVRRRSCTRDCCPFSASTSGTWPWRSPSLSRRQASLCRGPLR